MKRRHEMPFGARLDADGRATFRLWAPAAREVALVRPGQPEVALPSRGEGWFEVQVDGADAATRYAFRIDGGELTVPDPASRRNPDDVHAASQLTDPHDFEWPETGAAADWRGRPWHEAVVYELHVGTFTPEGTFAAAIGRLDDLVALGITAIELMPLASFPGQRGWGYDGVLLYAPQPSYGTPQELKQLVVAAHERGLMVLLDVVYNHFGPDGNYLHTYAPAFFNDAVKTPWGAAINFEREHSATVRRFFIDNALYWIEEFQFDGLRLDAVHAMHDTSPTHFVAELAAAVRAGPGAGRHVHVVLENDRNDALALARDERGRAVHADAVWNDDVHHTLHVIATGETDGYYVDFATDPLALFGRALAEGFAYQGEASPYRDGETRGVPSASLPPTAFVNSLQTHDQVGNRAFGDRIAGLAESAGRADALRALTACVLLAPAPPMLFMGEEYAAGTPFLYFCDFDGELARAVTEGRRNEFGRFARFSDPAVRERIPDPNAAATFQRSKLDWGERDRAPHAGWLALYTELLRARRELLLPWLDGARSGRWSQPEPGTLRIEWLLGGGRRWHLLARLADSPGDAALAAAQPGSPVYRSDAAHDTATALPAWSVHVTIETP